MTTQKDNYEKARQILRNKGYVFFSTHKVYHSRVRQDKLIRLEIYGGLSILAREEELQALLPEYVVARGDQEYIFVTFKTEELCAL